MAARQEIVPATPEHATAVAARLRPDDVFECWLVGQEPLEAALDSVARSAPDAWAWLVDDQVVAIYGVGPSPLGDQVGIVWMLTTDLVERYPKALCRWAEYELPRLAGLYPVLVNAVPARCATALRWAARAGFAIGPGRAYGGEIVHDLVLAQGETSCAR